jgi:hypothetical protein
VIRTLVLFSTLLATVAVAHADREGRQPYDVLGPDEIPPPSPASDAPPADGYDPTEPVAPVVEVHVPVYVPPPAMHPGFAFHLNVNAEILGGGNATSFVGRMHVGLSNTVDWGASRRKRVRPMLGAGLTAGMGILNVADRRGLDGSVDLGHFDYGPEVMLGLRFVNGGHVDTRIFATLAYLKTNLDKRLELDAIPGVGGREGIRAAVGINFADRIGIVMVEGTASSRRRGKHGGEWYIAMVPQQIEFAWERSAGSDRMGASFGWGI